MTSFTRILLSMSLLGVSSAPGDAITVELAKRCRELAIKAHPPQPAGTKAYAKSERDFFHECVSKKGEVPNKDVQPAQPAGSR